MIFFSVTIEFKAERSRPRLPKQHTFRSWTKVPRSCSQQAVLFFTEGDDDVAEWKRTEKV